MPNISELIHSAYSGIELTIDELGEYFNIEDESVLDKLIKCNEKLDEFGLSVDPPLKKGSIKQKRLIYIKDRNPSYNLKADLQKDEGFQLEFKSTFVFDIRQSKHRPDTPTHELDCKEVVNSVLKTICAFLNSGGGVLYVGITDEKEIFGLEKDFEYLQIDDFDKWELHLRNLIESRFYEGHEILKYCIVNRVEVEGKIVAKIDVKSRVKETFYKKENDTVYSFYIRNGNRTDPIPIERLPAHIKSNT